MTTWLVICRIRGQPSSQICSFSTRKLIPGTCGAKKTASLFQITKDPVATMWQQLAYDFLWENVTQLVSAKCPNRYRQYFFFSSPQCPLPYPQFLQMTASQFGFRVCTEGSVWSWKEFYRERRVPDSRQTGAAGAFVQGLLWKAARVNIRCFIALTWVTSSTRMKSSIPPGKTNLRSRESIRPIKGPAYPLISSQRAVKTLTGPRAPRLGPGDQQGSWGSAAWHHF